MLPRRYRHFPDRLVRQRHRDHCDPQTRVPWVLPVTASDDKHPPGRHRRLDDHLEKLETLRPPWPLVSDLPVVNQALDWYANFIEEAATFVYGKTTTRSMPSARLMNWALWHTHRPAWFQHAAWLNPQTLHALADPEADEHPEVTQ